MKIVQFIKRLKLYQVIDTGEEKTINVNLIGLQIKIRKEV